MLSSSTQLVQVPPRPRPRKSKQHLAITHQWKAQIKKISDNGESDTQPLISFSEDEEEGKEILDCVICIGSTGAGKSATISKCTKRPVSSGNGRDRVTVRCAKYDLRSDARAQLQDCGLASDILDLTWVDTVGWDDADLQGKRQDFDKNNEGCGLQETS